MSKLTFDSHAIFDMAENPFEGISADTTWSFFTGVPNDQEPSVVGNRVRIALLTGISLLISPSEACASIEGNRGGFF